MSFGPPSEPIRSSDFAKNASTSVRGVTRELAALWKKTKKQTRDHVQAELSLSGLHEQTDHVMENESLRNVVAQRYAEHATKQKEHDVVQAASHPEDSDDARMNILLDQNPLTHWPPPKHSIYYFRKNKKTDENALTLPKLTDKGLSLRANEAIITVSFYSRITKASNRNDVWVHGFALDATYTFLSNHTLRDIYNTFPCPARTIPQEIWEEGRFIGYETETISDKPLLGGIVMSKCAYGDGESPWARQMVEMSKKSRSPDTIQETRILQNTVLGELGLQLQMPYWILHQGNCSHCWVVEGIRLANISDPRSGYPIGLHQSKQPHPTCHHCGRNPVTLAVNGDPRLGESPSRICELCWKIMGPPQVTPQERDTSVVMVPCDNQYLIEERIDDKQSLQLDPLPPQNVWMSDLEDSQPFTTADIAASLDSWTGPLSEWINDLIEGDGLDGSNEPEGSQSRPVDLTELDNRVAQLATKLEVACQDTSSQLERTIEDISRNVPRLNFDLQFMRESALALQRELNTIHHNSSGTSIGAAPNDSTTKALEQLQLLDSVKKGMEAARVVLQEAENWSTLESEITSLIKEASYAKAAVRLSEAAKSMSVFQHTPEYESRRTLMINLQNQTEAALSAALVAAINVRDVTACKNFHEIFGKIEREGEFRNYYFGARRIGIQDLWSTTSLSDVQTEYDASKAGYSLKLSELLARFFGDLLTLVNEERSSVPSIFSTTPDPTIILSLFIQSVFETLAPSLSQRLSGMAAHYGSAALPELIKAFKMTEDFALKVEKIMEKVVLAKTGGLGPASPSHEEHPSAKGHSRQKSKRLSMSRRMPSHRVSISIAAPFMSDLADHSWEHALFEPFVDFQCEYDVLEKKFLDDALRSIDAERTRVAQRDAEMQARNLTERAMDVFGAAEEGLVRCLAFTHGYGVVGVIQAVDHLFAQFYSQARADLLQQPNGSIPTSDSDSNLNGRFEEELLSQDELTSFQLALNLLNTARAFKERMDGLDSRYMTELVQVSQILRVSNSYPNGHYISGTPKGEAELLAQSSLNSMSLTSLMESIEVLTPNPPFSAGFAGSFGAPPIPSGASGSVQRLDPMIPAPRQQVVLKGSMKALAEFSRAIQTFLQQLILSPLLSPLVNYHCLPIWSSTEQQGQKQRSYEVSVPTFSLSATPTMQRVCDGLRALPRMFEDYAGDDEALGFSLETLPFIERDLGLKDYLDWSAHGQNASSERNARSSPRSKRMSMSSPSFHRLSLPGSTNTMGNAKPPMLSADVISSAWISSMTLKLLSQLTGSVLPQIRSLSTTGSAQLAYDLEDLCNIARALNADWEDLERWRECCEMSNEEGRRRWLAVQGVAAFTQGNAAQEIGSDAIIKLVARMRGWTG